jgi:hypothetical protein
MLIKQNGLPACQVTPTEFATVAPTEEGVALVINATDLKRKKTGFFIFKFL